MKEIVNLRVDRNLKDNFRDICKLSNSCMSYEIIKFMKNYINDGSNRLKRDLDSLNEVESLRSKVRDKFSNDRLNDSRLKNFSW